MLRLQIRGEEKADLLLFCGNIKIILQLEQEPQMIPFQFEQPNKLIFPDGPRFSVNHFGSTRDPNSLRVEGTMYLPWSKWANLYFAGCVNYNEGVYSLTVDSLSTLRLNGLHLDLIREEDKFIVLVDDKEVDISGNCAENDPVLKGIVPFPNGLKASWWEQFVKLTQD